jgi:hypothetical protein
MKIKAQQMTFRQDITKYKIYWLRFRCIVHNIFRAIKIIYKRVLCIYTNSFKRLHYSNKRIRSDGFKTGNYELYTEFHKHARLH